MTLADMDDKPIQTNPPEHSDESNASVFETIIGIGAGLISAAAVPVFALFMLLTLLILGWTVYSLIAGLQEAEGISLPDAIGTSVGVSCFLSSYVLPLSAACVGSFGLPAAVVGWRLKLIQLRTCALVGFLLGSIPGGFFLYHTYSGGSSYANGVHYWINGEPTLAGLLELAVLILIMGIGGALGGATFWTVWRFFSKPRRSMA